MRRVVGIVAVLVALVIVPSVALAAGFDAASKRCGATPPDQQSEAYPAWRHSGGSTSATVRGFVCLYRDDQGQTVERLQLGWPPF